MSMLEAVVATVRDVAHHLGLTESQGYHVRLTGPVALTDDNFATVVKGAGFLDEGDIVRLAPPGAQSRAEAGRP